MQIIALDLADPASLRECVFEAAAVLRGGGCVVYPTDTLYGLGANALDAVAVDRVWRVKNRSGQKPLPAAVRDVAMAREVAVLSSVAEAFLRRVWPGAVTAVVRKRSRVPDILTAGFPTVGLRQPGGEFIRLLLGELGFPVTSTSANLSGEAGIWASDELREQLRRLPLAPDLVVDAGDLTPSLPSTVVDITGRELRILRAGPVGEAELSRIFSLARVSA